jgi:two-component system sensor histidine kinase MprB
MTFRARLVIAAAAAVAIAVLLASSVAWIVARNSLVSSVDDTLAQTANAIAVAPHIDGDTSSGALLQVTDGNGVIVGRWYNATLPVTETVKQVAEGQLGPTYQTVVVDKQALRELIVPMAAGQFLGSPGVNQTVTTSTTALQLAVPLSGVNQQLTHLELWLLAIAALGVLIAVILGFAVARTAIRPLDAVTEEIEEVAESTDLTRRLEEGGRDELGRLRRTFNRMLAALNRSQEQQLQLVLDASHELRTPLTSLKTNTEVLRRVDELDAETRGQLLDDVVTQLDELTALVGDLAELARGERQTAPPERFRLDQLVDDLVSIGATHGRTRNLELEAELSECWVVGRPERVGLAIGNLINNAIKWSPEGGTIEVSCQEGVVLVRDHGPGIAEDDLPKIFDRFYRSKEARAMPGSGLGLAIVAQVAAEEGGTVSATNAHDGGALLRFELPTL